VGSEGPVNANWVKSSYSFSNSNCVEARWAKSSYSTGGDCAEVRDNEGRVLLRDSKDPDGPVLSFAAARWAEFIAAVKSVA